MYGEDSYLDSYYESRTDLGDDYRDYEHPDMYGDVTDNNDDEVDDSEGYYNDVHHDDEDIEDDTDPYGGAAEAEADAWHSQFDYE